MLAACEKCGPSQAKLDVEANKAICTTCKQEVAVTEFAKNMMKSSHDILEKNDIQLPPNGMLASCENAKCARSFSAEVDEKDNVYCPFCKTEAKISSIAKNLLRSNGLLVGATKAYFEQEGKEAVSPAEAAKMAAVVENEPKVEVSQEELSNVFEVKELTKIEVDPKVAENAAKHAPSFRRAS